MALESEFEQADPLDTRNAIQDEHGTHPQGWFQWLHDRLPLRGEVLELGCGSGELWAARPQGGPAADFLVLTDQSIGMAGEAAQTAARLGLPHAALVTDAAVLPFAGERFDLVLAVGLFDLLPNLDKTLRDIQRVLKPGGRLACTAGSREHLSEMQDLVQPFAGEVNLGGLPERFGAENGAAILSAVFEQVSRQVFADELVFEAAAPLVEYILSEEHVRKSTPPEQQARFVSLVKQKLLKTGPVRVQREKVLFLAEKPAGASG